jgi:hypothetical protein
MAAVKDKIPILSARCAVRSPPTSQISYVTQFKLRDDPPSFCLLRPIRRSMSWTRSNSSSLVYSCYDFPLKSRCIRYPLTPTVTDSALNEVRSLTPLANVNLLHGLVQNSMNNYHLLLEANRLELRRPATLYLPPTSNSWISCSLDIVVHNWQYT